MPPSLSQPLRIAGKHPNCLALLHHHSTTHPSLPAPARQRGPVSKLAVGWFVCVMYVLDVDIDELLLFVPIQLVMEVI